MASACRGCTEPVSSFPLLELSEAEIVSVFVAQKALVAHRGTPFEQPLRAAYQKLVSGLNGRVSVPWAELAASVSFRGYQANVTELGVFEAVGNAVRQSRVLRFEYRGLEDAEFGKRTVEPYHLACVQGQWYLIAFDWDREDWRNFVLARMRAVAEPGDSFERGRAFDIDAYLRRSLGIFQGEGTHEVRLEFDAWSARLVRERAWHPAQELEELPEGRLGFSIQLSALEEIVPWVLSWGEHAEVRGPEELRARLRETIGAMWARIGKT